MQIRAQDNTEVPVGVREPGIDLDRLLVLLNGLVELTDAAVAGPLVDQYTYILRIKGKRFIIGLDCLGEALRNLPSENTRQVVTASKMLYAILLMVIVMYLPGGLISLWRRRTA